MKKLFVLSLIGCINFLLITPAICATSQEAQIEQGKLIYLNGVLPNQKNLVGLRQGIELLGEQAACVHCHRESGLGGVEGDEIVTPIAGQALFGGKDSIVVEHLRRFNRSLSTINETYDNNIFANAVRSGQNASGKTLNPLMPRYQLTDSEIDALISYLKTLSSQKSLGVDNKEIHIATVITPEISDEKKKAFTQTIQAMVNLHNVNVISGHRQKISPLERKMQNRRKWRLDVWSLNGSSNTWQTQLSSLQKNDPVFAVLSGLSENTWQPIQNFCEENKVACWFPSIEVAPINAEKSGYSLYFNQGTILDANVISHELSKKLPGRIIQIDDGSIAAKSAMDSFHRQMELQHIRTEDFSWNPTKLIAISKIIENLKPNDTIILWLHHEALNALTANLKAPTSTIYYSEELAGNSIATLNESWKNNGIIVSEIELSDLRSANLKHFRDWMNYRNIPITDVKMQSEVYFAVNSFDWMVSSLLNNFYTHYLVERAESYLSMYESMQVQEEVQALMMGGESKRPPQSSNNEDIQTSPNNSVVNRELLFKRASTSIYPRLSLGIGQRFASKGAYLIKTKPGSGIDAQWIVP